MATISVIVPAAGCGARAALNGNKVLAPVLGRPLLWWTLRALSAQTNFGESSTRTATIVEMIVAVRDEERNVVRAIYDETSSALPLRFARGGATRAESVRAAIEISNGDFVLVHDAARPCLTPEITSRVVASALQNGAAIAALPADDTVKHVVVEGENTFIEATLDRSHIYLAQTPQMFRRDWLRQAFEFAATQNWQGTDCASYVEHWARNSHDLHRDRVLDNVPKRVAIVRGDARNIKVTYADDLERAAHWLTLSEISTA